MANKRIRKKRAKLSGKAGKYHPQNLFRSDISIKSTEVSPYSETELVQTANRELAQLGYYFWFKKPIELEDVTRDEIKYLASGKVLKSFQANIEPMMTIQKNLQKVDKTKRLQQIVLSDYFNSHRISSVRGLTKAINELDRKVIQYQKELRKTEHGRKMLEHGTAPSLFTLVYYTERTGYTL